MHSCLYEGEVRHRRFSPRRHSFTYKLVMLYLDLAEVDQLFAKSKLWSKERFNFATWRRHDYHGDPDLSLDEAVRRTVQEQTGRRPTGPIRMLTHPRYLGLVFNPVTFYYCFDDADENVETIIAEITNTPWRQRRAYVLDRAEKVSTNGARHFAFRKDFHVSPFMPINQDYRWYFGVPREDLRVHMTNLQQDERVFDVDLSLARQPADARNLQRVLWRHPLMTAKVVMGIYWQALRLYLKKIPYFDHPHPDRQYHTYPERSSAWKEP